MAKHWQSRCPCTKRAHLAHQVLMIGGHRVIRSPIPLDPWTLDPWTPGAPGALELFGPGVLQGPWGLVIVGSQNPGAFWSWGPWALGCLNPWGLAFFGPSVLGFLGSWSVLLWSQSPGFLVSWLLVVPWDPEALWLFGSSGPGRLSTRGSGVLGSWSHECQQAWCLKAL